MAIGSIITIVSAVNTLLGLVNSLNMKFATLAKQIQAAQEEGREFDASDLIQIKKDARGSLNELGILIAKMKEAEGNEAQTDEVSSAESGQPALPEDSEANDGGGNTPAASKPLSNAAEGSVKT